MDFRFSEEEDSVAELARKILAENVTNERLKEIEAAETPVDESVWGALAEANLLGVAIPEAHGGMDLGFVALCRLAQEIGRSVAPVPVYASLALGALPIARFGSEPEQADWLPRIASGSTLATAALIELDSSDPLRPSTRAEKTGKGFRLSGEKSLVPSGMQADRILVPARSETGSIVLAWVTPDARHLELRGQQASDRQPHAHLVLDGVEVDATACLGGAGDRGDGAEQLRWLVERATVFRCATQLGVTERALEMTAEYGRERVQFDRAIGSFQAFHQRAGDAYINVEALRLTTWEAAWTLAREGERGGSEIDEVVSVAKYWAAEGAQSAAYACQHLHGGIGIDVDYPLHRYFIWATQIEHELGAAPHQLDRLGARLAESGVPAY